MKHLLTLAMTIAGLFLAATGLAHDTTPGGLSVVDPWARATIGKARSGAVYMTIVNKGHGDDSIIAVETPVARKAVIHKTEMEAGIMKMRPAGPVAVKKGGSATLRPGGMHVMLMGLRKPLKEGETFPLTLTFEKAGSVTLDVSVQNFAAKGFKRR